MKAIKLFAAIILLAFTIQSCRTGYGCTGKSKYITGYKGEKFQGYK